MKKSISTLRDVYLFERARKTFFLFFTSLIPPERVQYIRQCVCVLMEESGEYSKDKGVLI